MRDAGLVILVNKSSNKPEIKAIKKIAGLRKIIAKHSKQIRTKGNEVTVPSRISASKRSIAINPICINIVIWTGHDNINFSSQIPLKVVTDLRGFVLQQFEIKRLLFYSQKRFSRQPILAGSQCHLFLNPLLS